MNRAQTKSLQNQLKSGDISLGLSHEWVCAFGRQGGTAAMLQQSQENTMLMRRIVSMMNPQTPLEWMIVAILHGMEVDESGVYMFFDPGLSIKQLHALPLTKHLFHPNVYAADLTRWQQQDRPQIRRVRLVVPEMFEEKTFRQQQALLSRNEKTPNARIEMMTCFLNELTGTRGPSLLDELPSGTDFVGTRVSDKCNGSNHVLICYCRDRFGEGFAVDDSEACLDSRDEDNIGMSALLTAAY